MRRLPLSDEIHEVSGVGDALLRWQLIIKAFSLGVVSIANASCSQWSNQLDEAGTGTVVAASAVPEMRSVFDVTFDCYSLFQPPSPAVWLNECKLNLGLSFSPLTGLVIFKVCEEGLTLNCLTSNLLTGTLTLV